MPDEVIELVGPTNDDLKWLTENQWRILEEEWAMDDLISFICLFAKGYRPSWYHFVIADKLKGVSLREILRIMFVLPPRHGKSTLVSRYFPAWHLGRFPDERIIGTSYSGRLAERFGRHARNVMAHPRYPFFAELAQDSRSAQAWDVRDQEGGYLAAGLDGTMTGEGADILIIDDPVKSAKSADSDADRESSIEWYTETAYPRLQANGRIIVVGTRWRDDDLMGYILEQSDKGLGDYFELIHLPAIDSEGNALWPEVYPLPELAKREKNMSTRMWGAQYQGDPQPASGGSFKEWWWGYWHPEGMPLPPVAVKGPGGTTVHIMPEPLPTYFDRRLQSWDMTFGSKKETGSWVVGQVWQSRGAKRYLIDQYRQRVGFDDSVDAVRAMTRLHPKVIEKLIENKANGPAIINHLQNEIGGIIPVDVPQDKDKEGRATAIEPIVRAGNVLLPHPMLAPWVIGKDGFIDECSRFPYGKFNDQVDTMSQGLIAFEQQGAGKTRTTDTMGLNARSRTSYQGRDDDEY